MTEKKSVQESADEIKKIGEFLKKIDYAMLTTADETGGFQSRPMQTQQSEFNGGEIYFFTYDDSNKVKHLKANPQVNLAYAAPDRQDYLSIKGTARISQDKGKMAEVWNPVMKAWFPQGLDTPGIALIIVTAQSAEYWDAPSSVVAHAVGFIKGALTGHASPAGDNATVEFTG